MNIKNISERTIKAAGKQDTGYLVMPDGSKRTRDSRVTGLNNNVAVVGPSGCGQSTVMGVLNILEQDGSLIISDPKGGLYRSISDILEDRGYIVKKLDLTHPENSAHYNPITRVQTSQDIKKLAQQIVFNAYSKEGNTSRDPYWERNAQVMLTAFLTYMMESDLPREKMTLTTVMEMLGDFTPYEDEEIDKLRNKPVYRDFIRVREEAEENGEVSRAWKLFNPFINLSSKTLSCIITTLTAILSVFDSNELSQLFCGNDISFRRLANRKTALFVITSDTDRSNDILANIFYSQALGELCDYADNCCKDGRLPRSVTFLLDDFATNCCIANFDNIISNIRARNISAMLMLQSLDQLRTCYPQGSHTIMNNCDTMVFMGANSTSDAAYFAERANKPLHVMMEMPLHTSWVFRRTEKPRFVRNIDPEEYLDGVRQSMEEKEMFPF